MDILRVTREAEGIRRRLSVAKIADSGEKEVLHAVAENESTLAPTQEPDQAVQDSRSECEERGDDCFL